MRGQLFCQALSYVDVKEDAEDIVQEVLAKLWQVHDDIDNAKAMKSMAYVIAKNTSINITRNRKTSVDIGSANSLQTQNNPQDILVEHDMRQQLLDAITQLPVKQRAIVRMRNVERLSYKEIAQVLGITESSVRAIICKARMTLMKQMKASL